MSILHLTTATLASASTGTGPTGFSNINLSDRDAYGGTLNVFDSGNAMSFVNGATPAQIDGNGIPLSPLTASQSIAYSLRFNDFQLTPTTQWVLKWTPAGAAVLRFLGIPWSIVGTPAGCTVVGDTVTIAAGASARVIFTFPAVIGPFNVRFDFMPAAYAPTSSKPILCRVADEAAITAGKYFTNELLSALAGLNLKNLRFLNWSLNANYNNGDTLADWSNRTPATAICWQSDRYYSRLYAGDTTGTDFYTVARPSGISTSDWTDGETIQANVISASTLSSTYTIAGAASNGGPNLIRLTVSTTTGLATGQQIYISGMNSGCVEANGTWIITVIGTPGTSTLIDLQNSQFVSGGGGGVISVQKLTVTGKTNGTKLVAAIGAQANVSLAAGLATFIYNRALDVLLYAPFGILAGYPVEAMIDLCNRANVNMWYPVPMMANTGFVTSLTTLVRDTLNSTLCFLPEYTNETWNPGPMPYFYAFQMGQYFNIGGHKGYTGLRAAQIFSAMKPIWIATGRAANTLRCALMWQGFGDTSTVYYVLNGTDLSPTNNKRLCSFLGGTFSGTCSGAPNYATAGNRPADLADTGGYAIYTSGAIIRNWGYGGGSQIQTPYAIAKLQAWATALNGNPNHPQTLAEIDEDLRQGVYDRGTISTVSGPTINAAGNTLQNDQQVLFYTTGTLPSPLQTGKIYFVVNRTTSAFSVSTTYGGTAVSLTSGIGTQTYGAFNVPHFTVGNESLLSLATTVMQNVTGSPEYSPGWQQVVKGYDTQRAGFTPSRPPLRVELYEGGLEGQMPTADECTAMGITVAGSAATASAALVNGLNAWKNSTYGYNHMLSLFKIFQGTEVGAPTFGIMEHSKTPASYLLSGPSKWSCLPDFIGSPPFQMYYGAAAFTGVSN
jgi:hypothetical protein